jgi:3-oxoacyl-[acyl-carrier protein] reductase
VVAEIHRGSRSASKNGLFNRRNRGESPTNRRPTLVTRELVRYNDGIQRLPATRPLAAAPADAQKTIKVLSMPLNQELHGQTAVVTGSSSGIGRAIALEFARAGARVVVHGGKNREAAEAVAAEIRAEGGESASFIVDLAAKENHEPFVEQAWAWRNGVEIWVNNAGADVLTGGAAQWSFDCRLDCLWQVDVQATIRLARFVGAKMKQAGHGVILNVGWDGVERGLAGDGGELFAAAKGAVTAFTRSLAQSLAPQVRANVLAPGWIKTSWGDIASQTWQDRARTESLMNRWGTPDDVASVARFLASPAAAFISGQVVPVNGGFRTST